MAFSPENFLLDLPGTVFGAIESTGEAPAITSDGGDPTADVSVNTGDTAVTTVTATGTGTETFSIVGGAEALMFTINSSSGALAFTTTSVDGVYEVIVQATNDWGYDRQTITVTVAEVAYEGPLDLVPGAIVAYGQRALSAALLGSAVYTLQRDGDHTTQAFNSDAVTGEVDVAAVQAFIPASFQLTGDTQIGNDILDMSSVVGIELGQSVTGSGIPAFTYVVDLDGTDIYISNAATATASGVTLTFIPKAGVSLWNDQSGNGENLAQATITNQMLWNASVQGSRPGLYTIPNYAFEGQSATQATIPGGQYTVFIVASQLYRFSLKEGTGGVLVQCSFGQAPEMSASDGVSDAGGQLTDPLTGCVIMDAAWEFGSRDAKINGVAQTFASVFDAGSALGSVAGVVEVIAPERTSASGGILEILIYAGIMSDANRLAIRQNIATYYGITL